MSEYGDSYHIQKFCYLYAVKENDIVNVKKVSDSEFIFDLSMGIRYLYDIVGDTATIIRRSDADYVTDEMWKKEFSRRLKKRASIKGFYMYDLAERLGVSENTMNRYANGKSIPNGYMIQRLAHILDCSVEYLTNFDYLL